MLFYFRNWANLSLGNTLCVPPISRNRRVKIAIFENFLKFRPKTGSTAIRAVLNQIGRNSEAMLSACRGSLCSTDDSRRLRVLAHQRPEVQKMQFSEKFFWRFLPILLSNRSVPQKNFISCETPFQGLLTIKVWAKMMGTFGGNLHFCDASARRDFRFLDVFSR